MCFFFVQNALMTFEEEKMAKSSATLRAMEKRCSSNLSWSPSFSSFQSMKSRLWGTQILSNQQTQNVSAYTVKYFVNTPILQLGSYESAAWPVYEGKWVLYKVV